VGTPHWYENYKNVTLQNRIALYFCQNFIQ